MVVVCACGGGDSELRPDDVLKSELGLTDSDEVHSVVLTGGSAERADPDEVTVRAGSYVQFVSDDWLVHEVLFELDSLEADQAGFLTETDQLASPPLVQRNSRFVLSFDGAPPGRYPYVLEGNGRPGRGTIVVVRAGAR